MANWAYVKNGEVVESYDILPDCWQNISNFFALKDEVEYLKTLNWLPVKQLEYNYDPSRQKLDHRKFIVNADMTVTEQWQIVDIPTPPPPSIDDIEKMLYVRIQARLDDFAKTRNYDSILSACSYAMDINVVYKTEGMYCVQARSQTWDVFFQIMNSVKAGERALPMSFEEIEQELPSLTWPQIVPSEQSTTENIVDPTQEII